MILEGLVTTLDSAGTLNLAPMGPIVTSDLSHFTLRPFQTSRTYQNLKQHPAGVFHVTDDVELIARAALDGLVELPPTRPAAVVAGRVLADCCRWFEFQVVTLDDSRERTEIVVEVLHTGRVRDFLGFNRAKHAVLEATILATRLHLIPEADVRRDLAWLASPVQKTAGPKELAAWEFVTEFVENSYRSPSRT
ncbi:MAG TPA: DUF447 domain-containing protein [Planctomycetaceae bacterium]|nr:DUF447 domain-containing protein [Planctomycetaceae bacterium]